MSNTPFLFVPTFSWPAAPFGLLYTYASGGTTPKTTYSDAAGTVPNTNPVELDAVGSATVRLGPGTYDFVLLDQSNTVTLWTQVKYDTSIQESDITAALSQVNVGSALYPQTTTEIAAGVTPVNPQYAPLGVNGFDTRRYGMDPTGIATSDSGMANLLLVAVQLSTASNAPFFVPMNAGFYTFNNQITVPSANNIGLRAEGSVSLKYIGTIINTDTSAGGFVYFSGSDHSFGGLDGDFFIDANTLAAFCVFYAGVQNVHFKMSAHLKNALLDCLCYRNSGTSGPVLATIGPISAYPATANFNGLGKMAVCGRYSINIDHNNGNGSVHIIAGALDNGVSGHIAIQGQTSFAGWRTHIRANRFEMNDDGIPCVVLNYITPVASAALVTLEVTEFEDSTAGVTNCTLIKNINASLNVRPPIRIMPLIASNVFQYIYTDASDPTKNVAYDARYLNRVIDLNMTGVIGQFALGTSMPTNAATITAITKAASAVVTVNTVSIANPFIVNEYVTFSGVSGMTQINAQTGQITAIGGVSGAWAVTVAINSSGFSVYSSGGSMSVVPQSGVYYLDTTNHVMGYQDANILANVIPFGQPTYTAAAASQPGVASDTGLMYDNNNNANFTYVLPAISVVGVGWISPLLYVATAGTPACQATSPDKIGNKSAGSTYTAGSTVGNNFKVQAARGGWIIVNNIGFS